MVKSGPPSPLRSEDYDAIQDAVMETERGRWFLREFAHRNRNADTDVLLSAIQKLHDNLVTEQKAPDAQRITLDLADMANAITETKKQITAMGSENGDNDKVTIASNELDAIVRTAEKATGDILNTAEQVQEIAWNLREMGVDAESCDALDKYATDIYMACSFQDLTGQRTEKVIEVLQFIENRVLAMMDIWQMEMGEDEHPIETFDGLDNRPDSHLLNGPQLEDNATSQLDIDDMMSDDMFDSPVPDVAPNVEEHFETQALVENESDDLESSIDNSAFEIAEPEILETADVPCDPFEPEEKCEPAYVIESEPAVTHTAAEPDVAVTKPDYAVSSDDELVEIGTSDEFANISTDCGHSDTLYAPDGQPESDGISAPDTPHRLDEPTVEVQPKTGDMMTTSPIDSVFMASSEFEMSPATMDVSLPEPASGDQSNTPFEPVPTSPIDQIDNISSQEAPNKVEITGAIEDPTDSETSLSALSSLERQIIFS